MRRAIATVFLACFFSSGDVSYRDENPGFPTKTPVFLSDKVID